MNLEDLTKHQILLLTLLVSFVTSLATGIVTVSLMDYAPPSITKTVNRVVEKTVEQVVPPDAEEFPEARETITEKVVVVEKDGTLEDAVSSVSEGVVRVFIPAAESGTSTKFIGYGLVIDTEGTVVVPQTSVPIASIVDLSGNIYDSVLVGEEGAFAYYTAQAEDGSFPSVVPTKNTDELTLGSEVFALSGSSSFSLERGIVTELPLVNTAGAASISSAFKTDIHAPHAGIPLFNTQGLIVAFSGKKGEAHTFMPIEEILSALQVIRTDSAGTTAQTPSS